MVSHKRFRSLRSRKPKSSKSRSKRLSRRRKSGGSGTMRRMGGMKTYRMGGMKTRTMGGGSLAYSDVVSEESPGGASGHVVKVTEGSKVVDNTLVPQSAGGSKRRRSSKRKRSSQKGGSMFSTAAVPMFLLGVQHMFTKKGKKTGKHDKKSRR